MVIAFAGRPNPILEAHRFLRRGPISEEHWSQLVAKDRDWERSYRGRWAHDKVVRSTHGVNCTGSCSWNVYVKELVLRLAHEPDPRVQHCGLTCHREPPGH